MKTEKVLTREGGFVVDVVGAWQSGDSCAKQQERKCVFVQPLL